MIAHSHPDLIAKSHIFVEVGHWREIQGGVPNIMWLNPEEILEYLSGKVLAQWPRRAVVHSLSHNEDISLASWSLDGFSVFES